MGKFRCYMSYYRCTKDSVNRTEAVYWYTMSALVHNIHFFHHGSMTLLLRNNMRTNFRAIHIPLLPIFPIEYLEHEVLLSNVLGTPYIKPN